MANRPSPDSPAGPARRAATLAAAALLCAGPALAQDLPNTLPDRLRPPQPSQSQPNQSQPGQSQPAQPDDSPADRARPVHPPATTGNPDEETDPGRRIILQSSRAIRELNSLSYRSKFFGTGPIEQIAPRGDGLVRMARSERNERVWVQRATGTGMPKAGDPELTFDVSWQEVGVEWVDHAQKKLMARPLRQAKGPAYQVAGAVRLLELLDATPLSKEIQAEGFTLESPTELDGVPCQVVLITLAGGRTQTRWWIADTDHLPRKMSRLFSGPNGSGEIVIELTEVTPNAPLSAADLQVQLPPGYSRDEAGPAIVPPNARRDIDAPAATPDNSNHRADAPPAPAHPAAPAFELPAAAGGKVSLASLTGHVVVLQFWGTWHLPSRAACADLQALTRQFENQKVKVFALSIRERDDGAPREFIRANNYTFGLLLDADKTADAYGVARYPTYAVIGPGGELLDTIVGYKKDETFKKLAEAVARAVAAMSPTQATGPAPTDGG
ncbi:MAG: redoxin domain-containing protein [Phycisphaerales bacterium]|nr:redoxin domain-containing protein [Phycisphaerales bacterium]